MAQTELLNPSHISLLNFCFIKIILHTVRGIFEENLPYSPGNARHTSTLTATAHLYSRGDNHLRDVPRLPPATVASVRRRSYGRSPDDVSLLFAAHYDWISIFPARTIT